MDGPLTLPEPTFTGDRCGSWTAYATRVAGSPCRSRGGGLAELMLLPNIRAGAGSVKLSGGAMVAEERIRRNHPFLKIEV